MAELNQFPGFYFQINLTEMDQGTVIHARGLVGLAVTTYYAVNQSR